MCFVADMIPGHMSPNIGEIRGLKSAIGERTGHDERFGLGFERGSQCDGVYGFEMTRGSRPRGCGDRGGD